MNTIKTNLAQSLEEIQENNEMIAIINSYRDKIVNSMAVPTKILGGGSENYLTMYPEKPTMIKIDVTKY